VNLGIMTLVFALVERAMRTREAAGTGFDPSKLPPVEDPDKDLVTSAASSPST